MNEKRRNRKGRRPELFGESPPPKKEEGSVGREILDKKELVFR